MSMFSKIASLTAVCFSVVALLTCHTPADAAVVGFYNFNENGGTTAADTSGNGFDGTLLSNATLPQWDPDSPSGDANNYSLQFQGGTTYTGSRVDIGTPAPLQLIGSRTISYWVKKDLTGTTARDSILGKSYTQEGTFNLTEDGVVQNYYGSHPNPAESNGAGGGAFTTNFSPVGSVADDAWTHVVHTRDSANSRQQYYINGVGLGSTGWTTHNPGAISNVPWMIGNGYAGAYEGKMDSVGFFDEELNAAEIASVYQLDAQPDNGLRAMGLNVPELDALWTIYDGGLGNSDLVNGQLWKVVDGINPGSFTLGQSWTEGNEIDGFRTYLLLGSNSGLLLVPPIPEPSSFLLMGMGMLGLVRHSRRRRSLRS